jgi:putative oxidoreductase
MNNNLLLGAVCLLVLYVYSSYGKLMDINGTAESLHSKLLPIMDLPMNLCQLAIIGVIILELFGSLFVVYSIYTKEYKEYLYYVVLAFIGFNVLATILYHYPNNKKELVNFLKNLSITGGFILLLDQVKNY